MDNHAAMMLSGSLAGHTEAVRFVLPGHVSTMENAAQRMEWAVQEFTRQVDRLEALMTQTPPTPAPVVEP